MIDTSVTITAERYAELVAKEVDAERTAAYPLLCKRIRELEELLDAVCDAAGDAFQRSHRALPETVARLYDDARKWRTITAAYPPQGHATPEDTIFYLCKDGQRWEAHLSAGELTGPGAPPPESGTFAPVKENAPE